MIRPPNQDRKYLASRIEDDYQVLVPGFGVISRIEDLPSQAEIDARNQRKSQRQTVPANSVVRVPKFAGLKGSAQG